MDARWFMIGASAAMVTLGTGGAGIAAAQMPGAPVLQNAFVAPGFTGALDFGTGAGSVYALAGGWAPGTARFQLSAGVGFRKPTFGGSSTTYGVRAAAPLFAMGERFGLALFAGYGGASSAGAADSLRTVSELPLGASLGFRQAVGSTHGFSLYATPMWVHATGPSGKGSESLFRTSIGADAAVTSAIGLTVGAELGPSAKRIGPSGTRWGVAVSYALGRR